MAAMNFGFMISIVCNWILFSIKLEVQIQINMAYTSQKWIAAMCYDRLIYCSTDIFGCILTTLKHTGSCVLKREAGLSSAAYASEAGCRKTFHSLVDSQMVRVKPVVAEATTVHVPLLVGKDCFKGSEGQPVTGSNWERLCIMCCMFLLAWGPEWCSTVAPPFFICC